MQQMSFAEHFNIANFYTFLRFVFVGLTAAAVNFSCFALLYDVFHINYKVALTVSYFLSVVCHFTLNRTITFRAQNKKLLQQLYKYLVLLIINYLLTLSIVITTVNVAHLSPYVGMILTTAATCVTSFLIGKFWVYN